jgi:hypothetical protein
VTSTRLTAPQGSLGAWAAGAAVGVLAAHLGLRPWNWTSEWLLATWQYSFAIVMLAPLVCGFTAWAAASLARGAGPGIRAAGRVRAVLARCVFETIAGPVLVFLCGYLLVLVVAWAVGSPGTLESGDVLPIVGPLTALLCYSALGAAVGWRLPHVATAPLLAMAAFGLGVLAYGTPMSFIIDVGGASGSLLGLEANPARLALQSVFFVVAASLAVALADDDPLRSTGRRVRLTAALGGLVALAGVVAATEPPRLLVKTDDEIVCGQASRSAPQVCLGPGYQERIVPISAALAQPTSAALTLGAVLPNRFDQRFAVPGAAVIDPEVLRQGPDAPAQVVVNAILPPGCDVLSSPELLESFTGMVWLLSPSDARAGVVDPSQLPAALTGPEPEQRAWGRDAVERLRACGL